MVVENRPRPRIGLLGLTLELYEELCPALRESRERWLRERVLPALAPLADVAFDGAVFRREEIEAAVAGYEAGGVDGLVVVCLTYSPSQLSLPALRRTDLPILVWNTQELFSIGDDFDSAAITLKMNRTLRIAPPGLFCSASVLRGPRASARGKKLPWGTRGPWVDAE